ncbi:platelet-derived growth factor subunit A-like isoform X1 [Leucoraja erinacea]|uniref:platelet-derived growth factor subunit A-like isoform X1 n=1 Tax=Leucoraja erinaceus TaxID=7782 RepID=UPI00245598AA|nr:platelet-derived growth factor subunit A-like isoform X1 [Leucoraja erinacea]
MDFLQKITENNMKSQLLVFLSLFCFWTAFSEGRDTQSISITSPQTPTTILTTPPPTMLPDMPKDIDKEDGLPDDVLKIIGQADIQSIGDLEYLLGVEAKDPAGIRPRSRTGVPRWRDSYKSTHDYLRHQPRNDEHSPPWHHPVLPQELQPQNQQPAFKEVHSRPKAAGCKTRIVTVDVPRYKVDPTSVGFFLWPSCVEVQRCSGCCNTKTYKCIPSHASYRSFQIAKLSYRYGRKELTIHTVSIREHLSCNCTELAKLHHPRFPSKYYKQSTDN